MITRIAALTSAVCTVLLPAAAHAYIGPGAGASLAGSLLAVLAAIATALAIVLFWPLRLLYRKFRCGRQTATGHAAVEDSQQTPSPGTAE
jgi:hypothetical protein